MKIVLELKLNRDNLEAMSSICLKCDIFVYISVKPHPEAHIDMILFEVFLKNIDLIPQQHIYITTTLFIL